MSGNGVTKQDLIEVRDDFRKSIGSAVELLTGRLLAAGNQWVSKADEDYTRVLAELADLKIRMIKPEGGQ